MDPKDVVDESLLDPEALQAQIDMSMSFAQDLVSSWLDPSKFSKSTRKQELEKELTDYMRRPPRLGVGAAVPAGHQANMSRETARLKGKLAGSKRARQDDATTSKLASNDEDDERETKFHAIKKKAKVDPFDIVHGKKKKKQKQLVVETTLPAKKSTSVPEVEGSSGEVENLLLKSPAKSVVNDVNSTPTSPTKGKKNKKSSEEQKKVSTLTSSNDSLTNLSKDKDDNTKTVGADGSSAASISGTPRDSKKKANVDLSKISLLNLTGPPPTDADSAGESDGALVTSPKKKRKRRKKKKNAVTQSNDGTLDEKE